ncbi:MAG: cytochrome c [Alphaproteobacteria bacterium]|nr:cytochrome c [Alphaproteobacteria bacterium]
MKALRDEVHAYGPEQLPDSVAERLALFVTRGQHDVDRFIDKESSRARGDAGHGERVFQNVCAACHGFDGKAINFKSEANPEFIGTVANANPWEALHKIRNGHPGVPMPALRFLPIQNLVDILAYAQTLPPK